MLRERRQIAWTSIAVAFAVVITTVFFTHACICVPYEYVSLEGQAGLSVVKRGRRAGPFFTFPEVPSEYVGVRKGYRIVVSTGERIYPTMDIRAFDQSGRLLKISGRGMTSRLGPDIQEGVGYGSWSFAVIRDGTTIGSETLRYELESRPLACHWRK